MHFNKQNLTCAEAFSLFLLLIAWYGCSPMHAQTNILLTEGPFTVSAQAEDSIAARNVLNELSNGAQSICRRLGHDFHSAIIVTLYPDQAMLDRDGMNPSMRGFKAYSGNNRIEMITPSKTDSLPGYVIPYQIRVRIVLHEFTHLVINDINTNMPLWVNEGVACFVGPHELYEYVCLHKFPFEMVPSISVLQDSYQSVRSADLFSYAAVDFIHAESSDKGLLVLTRQPEKFLTLVNAKNVREFDLKWKAYLSINYRKD